MNGLGLPGVVFRPAVFEPTFHKHAQPDLRRLPDSRARSRGVQAGRRPASALIAAFRAADPDGFRWRDPPYEYEHEKLPFDILAGSSELREQIEAGVGRRDRQVVGRERARVRPRATAFLLY